MDSDDEQAAHLRREVGQLRAQVHAIRLVLLRVPAILALALIAVGSVLPAWSDTIEDEPHTFRVLTAGFAALADPIDGFGVAIGIGFLGLLLVLLLLCGVLVTSVIGGRGRAEHARVRGLIRTLAVVGSVVAMLFSLVAWGSDETDVSGGAGPAVLLVGVTVSVVVMSHRAWHDLWIDQR